MNTKQRRTLEAVFKKPVPASIPWDDIEGLFTALGVLLLTALALAQVEPLNWQTSIVDLLKLLGLDSSLNARKELAKELACPPEKMNDSAQMNMWLQKAVLQKLAQNGGNIPEELLH